MELCSTIFSLCSLCAPKDRCQDFVDFTPLEWNQVPSSVFCTIQHASWTWAYQDLRSKNQTIYFTHWQRDRSTNGQYLPDIHSTGDTLSEREINRQTGQFLLMLRKALASTGDTLFGRETSRQTSQSLLVRCRPLVTMGEAFCASIDLPDGHTVTAL